MSKHVRSALLLSAALGMAAAVAAAAGQEMAPDLTVHEWGTFTSVAGSDGQSVDWAPLNGPQDLPCFVDRHRIQIKGRDFVGALRVLPAAPSRAGGALTPAVPPAVMQAKIRMETPVLYFYSPASLDVPGYPYPPYPKPARGKADNPGNRYPFALETLTNGIREATISGSPYPVKGWLVYATNLIQALPNEAETIRAIQDWITPDWQCTLASASGGGVSPYGGHGVAGVERLPGHADTDPDCLESESGKIFAEGITTALDEGTFVFDASDLMPPEIGQEAFWQAMVDHATGTPIPDIVAAVEAAWP